MNRKQRRATKSISSSTGRNTPSGIQASLNLALDHQKAGRLAEAEQLYRKILETEPDHADSLHLLGVIVHQKGQHDEAVDLIGRAIRLNGNVHLFHNSLGLALNAQGKTDEAVAAYEGALTLKADFSEAYYNLGVLYAGRNDDAQAAAQFQLALTHRIAFPEAWFNLGSTLARGNRIDDAVQCYERALAINPDFADAYNNLGALLAAKNRQQEAIALYNRAIEIKPDFAEAYNNLGAALKTEGRLEDAAACYERACSLKTPYADAESGLQNVLYMLSIAGRRDHALAYAARWVAKNPANQTAAHSLAALTGDRDTAPVRAADGYVETVFDGFANDFDSVLGTLDYRGPALIEDVLNRAGLEKNLDILDIGCGTGLSGIPLKFRARSLTGVDLSQGMLAKAAARHIYDHLYRMELTEFLNGHPASYDLITAADLFIYFGDLLQPFIAVAGSLRPGGHIAFTAELLVAPEPEWHLMTSGRYAHGEDYIRQCLAKAGFKPVAFKTGTIRKENAQSIDSLTVLARRAG